ncbi:HAD family hydrolase [Sinosporangium siamense]|uniref:Haloacid dehalogenase-like hydrolase n=2 Tax=Sinosporangium siamense TaxID=1367973 RepID=A0A919RN74_9ACTN|nr:HAD family hydrolase [Sinosporangium siamense]GII96876.1 putative haloacid dehalogenase-like hydrolase [Sinosporangium siamense]
MVQDHTDGATVSAVAPIRLVCLDLAVTTIGDTALIERAFAEAIATQGIVPGTSAYARAMVHVHRSRGCSTIDVFRGIFPANEAQAQAAHLTFERACEGAIERAGLVPPPGTIEVLDKLRGSGVRICLITGLSRNTLSRVLGTLGWVDKVDLALCPEDVGRGRPWPDMILHAILRLGIDDVHHVAVVGETESDMLAGRRAGAQVTAGILTGAQSQERLLAGGATHILPAITSLPDLILTTDATTHHTTATAR